MDMLFYGFGAAATLLNTKDVEKRADEDHDRRSRKLLKIMGNSAEYVNTLQLVVTLIHVVMGAVYLRKWTETVSIFLGDMVAKCLKHISISTEVTAGVSTVLSAILLLYILLTFVILMPKKIAARIPEKWAYFFINPVCILMVLLKPFVKPVVSCHTMIRPLLI
jgi:putative hemolysin